jgi:phosphatidylserine decarboxylase
MTDNDKTGTERRRLGGWLPSNEEHLARYRTDLAKKPALARCMRRARRRWKIWPRC